MKKEYSGLDAVFIELEENQVILSSSKCRPVYTTHFDTNNNLVCDSQEYVPGASEYSTQYWNDCEIGDEAD